MMRHEEELQKAVAFEQEKLNKLKSKRDKEEAETAFQQALAIEMQSATGRVHQRFESDTGITVPAPLLSQDHGPLLSVMSWFVQLEFTFVA